MKFNIHPLGAPIEKISATIHSVWMNDDKGVVITTDSSDSVAMFEDELTGLINALVAMRDNVLPAMNKVSV
jgi:hypothetical protein